VFNVNVVRDVMKAICSSISNNSLVLIGIIHRTRVKVKFYFICFFLITFRYKQINKSIPAIVIFEILDRVVFFFSPFIMY
jgi:hypothetical protein